MHTDIPFILLQSSHESQAVAIFMGHIEKQRAAGKSTTFQSAHSYEKFPEQVFVWALGDWEIEKLARKYSFMFHSKISMVNREDWLHLHASLDKSSDLSIPGWVRIKSGLYRDDLALVERSYSVMNKVDVLVVPRLLKTENRRPPPQLLSPEKAVNAWGQRAVKIHPSEPHWFNKRKTLIKYGLHSLYLSRSAIVPALPKALVEVGPFIDSVANHSLVPYLQEFVFQTTNSIQSTDLITTFRPYDRVTIPSGSFGGTYGRIKEIVGGDSAILTLEPVDGEGRDIDISCDVTVSLKEIRRVFKIGDSIHVIRGNECGRRGIVVHVDGPFLTFSEHDSTHGNIIPEEVERIDSLNESLFVSTSTIVLID